MSGEATALIDTVDSGAHYRVRGSAAEVTETLARAGAHEMFFVEFVLAQRNRRSIFIAPDKVIAVLDPS